MEPSHIVHIGRGKRETCSESLNEDATVSSVFQHHIGDRAVLAVIEPFFPGFDDIASLYLTFIHACF